VDTVVNAGAVVYGLVLVLATFARHPLTEAMRLDSLFLGKAEEKTRPLNLIVGLLVAGYGGWSLLK
jgi:hypothetical protein